MRRAVLVLAIALSVAGCSSGSDARSSFGSPSEQVSATTTSSASPEPAVPSEAVSFRASDGKRIAGRLFGEGDVGVVLAHELYQDQSAWFAFAEELAGRGYVAMTFDFRGYCPGGEAGCSADGNAAADGWQDLAGATRFLRRRGVERVYLTGASLGGSAVLQAAVQGVPADAVVTLSGVPSAPYDLSGAELSRIVTPVVFIVGRFDGSLAGDIRRVYNLAPEPKELLILPTGEHGTNLLRFASSSVQAKVRDLLYASYGRP